jgi:hypothetical protein
MTFALRHDAGPTAYQQGYADGVEGFTLNRDAYRNGSQQDRYTRGWHLGYRTALENEVTAYNRTHGTVWEPREGMA